METFKATNLRPSTRYTFAVRSVDRSLQPHTRYRFTVEAGDAAHKWTGSGPSTVERTEK